MGFVHSAVSPLEVFIQSDKRAFSSGVASHTMSGCSRMWTVDELANVNLQARSRAASFDLAILLQASQP